jgi:hypothetical protein
MLLTTGVDRLARKGARRLKVGFETDAARNLYLGVGFVWTSIDRLSNYNRWVVADGQVRGQQDPAVVSEGIGQPQSPAWSSRSMSPGVRGG